MANDKCCCAKTGPIIVFLVGLVLGGIIVGVLVAYGQLDFLQGKVLGTKSTTSTATKPGVMFETTTEGAWVQVSQPDVEGAWVQMTNNAWVQLTQVTEGTTKEGAWVQFSEGAWVQLVDNAWVQFSNTSTDGAWVQLKEGAWVQLTADTQVKDANGAWVQLAEGAWVQLANNALVQFQTK